MAHTQTWDANFQAHPPDSDSVGGGGDDIRDLKEAIQERMALDHYWPTANANNDDQGYHSKITFRSPQANDPSNVADRGVLYTKDVSNVAELHYLDESNNAVQITGGGAVRCANLTDGTYFADLPANLSANVTLLTGDANTIAWFRQNSAPPGWVAAAGGEGKVIGIAANTYLANGTTTGSNANQLIDSGANFIANGVQANDWVYNASNGATAQVSNVAATILDLTDDIFLASNDYRIGGLCCNGGEYIGNWQQHGHTLTANEGPIHNHPIPHGHKVYDRWGTGGIQYTYFDTITYEDLFASDNSGDAAQVTTYDVTPEYSGNSSNNANGGDPHDHGNTWIPDTAVGKCFSPDVA